MWFVVKHAEFLVAFQIHKRFDKGTYGSESRGEINCFPGGGGKNIFHLPPLPPLLMYSDSEGDNHVRARVCGAYAL